VPVCVQFLFVVVIVIIIIIIIIIIIVIIIIIIIHFAYFTAVEVVLKTARVSLSKRFLFTVLRKTVKVYGMC
jgi:hypothetical protein